jgi:hypothetical protein
LEHDLKVIKIKKGEIVDDQMLVKLDESGGSIAKKGLIAVCSMFNNRRKGQVHQKGLKGHSKNQEIEVYLFRIYYAEPDKLFETLSASFPSASFGFLIPL